MLALVGLVVWIVDSITCSEPPSLTDADSGWYDTGPAWADTGSGWADTSVGRGEPLEACELVMSCVTEAEPGGAVAVFGHAEGVDVPLRGHVGEVGIVPVGQADDPSAIVWTPAPPAHGAQAAWGGPAPEEPGDYAVFFRMRATPGDRATPTVCDCCWSAEAVGIDGWPMTCVEPDLEERRGVASGILRVVAPE